MVHVSGSLLLGVVLLGIAAPIYAWSWGGHHHENHHHGNWTFSPPDLCDHNDSETHVCSWIDEKSFPVIHIICCSDVRGNDHVIAGTDVESSEAIDETEDTCDEICVVVRNRTVFQCFTDCCAGYTRNSNLQCQDKEEELVCENGGTKVSWFTPSYCKCPTHYYGRTCHKYECPCRNGGHCVLKDGQPQCQCHDGFKGKYCEQHECGLPCKNGANCLHDGTRQMCNCSVGYVGKLCETKFVQSDKCPLADPYPRSGWGGECYNYCTNDDQCSGDMVCCQSGCHRVCRMPMCNKDGHMFPLGEDYKPSPCETCSCIENGETVCAVVDCAMPLCKEGTKVVTHPGMCCPVCEDEQPPTSPPKVNCSRYPVQVDLPPREDKITLTSNNTKVWARDYKGRPLQVTFEPTCLKHCHCTWSRQDIQTVIAYTRDSFGGMARCAQDVYVRDPYAPVFTTCPEDVYVFEGERVTWQEPTYYDNVGVQYNGVGCVWQKDFRRGAESCSQIKGQRLSAGNYTVQYVVTDFDDNMARCIFHLGVLKQDTPWNELPEGLRERSKEDDSFNIGLVVGPIIGAIGIFALILALCLWIRMKKQCRSETRRRAPAMPHPTFDNNIYHVPTDVSLKPPPYSLPTNPPPYSSNGDLKEGEYTYIDPPSYTESSQKSEGYVNPEYATLETDQKSEV